MKNGIWVRALVCGAIAWTCFEPATAQDALRYRGALTLNDSISLPFHWTWSQAEGASAVLFNADERIQMHAEEPRGDSLVFSFPVFNNAFHLAMEDNGSTLRGFWVRYDAGNQRYPLVLTRDDGERFPGTHTEGYPAVIRPRYKLTLEADQTAPTPAVWELDRVSVNGFYGSILTESGDYRFLQGNVIGNRLWMSTFDGIHAYVFRATVSKDGTLKGHHFSGKKYAAPFAAAPSEDFQLRDPDQIARMKPGSRLDAVLPEWQTGAATSLAELTRGKVAVVQVFGSWCPNCMDETRMFTEFHEKLASKGVVFVAVAFERSEHLTEARIPLAKCVRDLSIPYPVLFGGKIGAVPQVFPGLENFGGYPTALFVDKKGNVRTVSTGFYGPGTRKYMEHRDRQWALLAKLLAE
jgi:thiol-disulfide isomerase/thioredoxin